ncbi:MAG: class I SAM-dependent methyltransferase [Phototrophicaceae bacterium]|jgi:trans-aconitate methyltransferase
MPKMYDELAKWWHLLSPPEEYVEEAADFLNVFSEVTASGTATLLELGSGGGNNASLMKSAFAAVTLVELSPQMLAVSHQLNPECEHQLGDMRTVRLGRTFDAVFIHDAIDYMLTLDDLRQAIESAFLHCKSGGMALFVPDHVTETFEPSSDHAGTDSTDGSGRGIRYLEWTGEATGNIYVTDYAIMLREGNQVVGVEHDQHTHGLFDREEWLTLLREAGFEADFVRDSYERFLFIGRKAIG